MIKNPCFKVDFPSFAPKVAVMILNFNGKHLLETCLDSVLNSSYSNFEVYVVDNGSTDGSVDFVRRRYPTVEIIAFDSNYGFCKAYNKSISSIDCPYVALLNTDTEVTPDWITELMRPMIFNKKIVITGSKLLLFDNRDRFDYAGTVISPIGGGFKIGFFLVDRGQFDSCSATAAACGASMIVNTKVFCEIGGFDEMFSAYSEDLDIGWRSWLFGYKVFFVPKSVVFHMLGASWGSNYGGSVSPQKVFLIHRNMLLTVLKNFNFLNVFTALVLYLPFSLFKVIYYLLKCLPHHSLSVLKVYWWVLSNLKVIVQKRRDVQSRRVVSDGFLKKKGLILSWVGALNEFRRIFNKKLE